MPCPLRPIFAFEELIEFTGVQHREYLCPLRGPSQFALLFLLFHSPSVCAQEALPSKSGADRQPLEIKLARPPSWHDHYLEITITRVNHSKLRIFLAPTPFEGIKMYSSVTQVKSTLDLSGPEAWILVYGWTDVIELEPLERTLAPGREKQDTYYLGETFPVTDIITNATRQVRLQGKLRILAGYGQKVPKKKNRKASAQSTPTKEADSDGWSGGQATLEIQIPCPVGMTNSDCLSPAPLFSGEHYQWTIFPKAPVMPKAPIL
jgi:hypothetical protein